MINKKQQINGHTEKHACFHNDVHQHKGVVTIDLKWGPPRGKRDGVIRHILERENGNWMRIIA